MRHVLHVGVDDAQIHQRRCHAGPGAEFDFPVSTTGEVLRPDMGNRSKRAGLRHPVACKDVDACGERLLGQRLRQGRAADHHLEPVQIDVRLGGSIEQHLQDGRHAVGEGDALTLDQLDQHRRLVAPGIDLLDTCERRRPGEPPGVDVKHRRDRHVDVVARKAALRARHAKQSQPGQRVEHELPVAVIDPLGRSGCARRVEGGRLSILVEIREVVVGRSRRK